MIRILVQKSSRYLRKCANYTKCHGGGCICATQQRQCHNHTLHDVIKAKIQATGPITIAEYMKHVLTNTSGGYYMHRDVFGVKGDFTTSPEISQMFGELIGIWCVNEWMEAGSPKHIQVVELGPGRGTLADDMLRVFSQFAGIRDAVSLHMVEISPKLSEMQAVKLTGDNDVVIVDENSTDPCYRSCKTRHGFDVSWYRYLKDVPKEFTFFIAHEFFDALPIYKFQLDDGQWNEILIDVDWKKEDKPLYYILSGCKTPAMASFLKIRQGDKRDHIEVCPDGGAICQEIGKRIAEDGGFALIADYGHEGTKGDTFRAFKKHKLHDPLIEPGSADITADVDFGYLKDSLQNIDVTTYGTITQEKFLHNMGIQYRLQALLQKAEDKVKKDLFTGYDMLTNPTKMGERFKFLSIGQSGKQKDYKPAGFKSPT